MGSREGRRRQGKRKRKAGLRGGWTAVLDRAAGHLPAQPGDSHQGTATDTAQQQCPGLRGWWTWERVQPEGLGSCRAPCPPLCKQHPLSYFREPLGVGAGEQITSRAGGVMLKPPHSPKQACSHHRADFLDPPLNTQLQPTGVIWFEKGQRRGGVESKLFPGPPAPLHSSSRDSPAPTRPGRQPFLLPTSEGDQLSLHSPRQRGRSGPRRPSVRVGVWASGAVPSDAASCAWSQGLRDRTQDPGTGAGLKAALLP